MVQKIALDETRQFSSFFLDYLNHKPELQPFYLAPVSLDGFKGKIEGSYYSTEKRKNLVAILEEQYHEIATLPAVKDNIDALGLTSSYTITTGHQLNIFTGPLYFIYKIATAINLARRLTKEFPDKQFVPVYWMASEDHDFEEINNFLLFGKTFTWNTSQTGAVGRFHLAGIEEIINEITDLPHVFVDAYRQQSNLANATRFFVNEIFGKYGLVVMDGDSRRAKRCFANIALEELRHQSSVRIVGATNEALEALGYKPQVHVRPINLFYLHENLRQRIVKENDVFKVLETEITFTDLEIENEVANYPERFSPNVILRPLYQEAILPNIAYIGGPAEIIYWLQLKALFDYHKLPFPLLVPRNFAMYVPKSIQSKLDKLQITVDDMFLEDDVLKKKVLKNFGTEVVDLGGYRNKINELFQELEKIGTGVDKSLEGYVQAEASKAGKLIDEIEKKFKKAEERKNEDHLRQMTNVKSKLFPGGGLQERSENFLNYAINDPSFVDTIVDSLDPLDTRFQIIIEDD